TLPASTSPCGVVTAYHDKAIWNALLLELILCLRPYISGGGRAVAHLESSPADSKRPWMAGGCRTDGPEWRSQFEVRRLQKRLLRRRDCHQRGLDIPGLSKPPQTLNDLAMGRRREDSPRAGTKTRPRSSPGTAHRESPSVRRGVW